MEIPFCENERVVSSAVTKFFKALTPVLADENYHYMFQNKKYRLPADLYEQLMNVDPEPGTFRNLEERNVQRRIPKHLLTDTVDATVAAAAAADIDEQLLHWPRIVIDLDVTNENDSLVTLYVVLDAIRERVTNNAFADFEVTKCDSKSIIAIGEMDDAKSSIPNETLNDDDDNNDDNDDDDDRSSLYLAILECNGRFHIHFLNLYARSTVDAYKWKMKIYDSIKHIVPNSVYDARAGNCHFLSYGSQKLRAKSVRRDIYKPFLYVKMSFDDRYDRAEREKMLVDTSMISKLDLQRIFNAGENRDEYPFRYSSPSLWRLLSLQRPLDKFDVRIKTISSVNVFGAENKKREINSVFHNKINKNSSKKMSSSSFDIGTSSSSNGGGGGGGDNVKRSIASTNLETNGRKRKRNSPNRDVVDAKQRKNKDFKRTSKPPDPDVLDENTRLSFVAPSEVVDPPPHAGNLTQSGNRFRGSGGGGGSGSGSKTNDSSSSSSSSSVQAHFKRQFAKLLITRRDFFKHKLLARSHAYSRDYDAWIKVGFLCIREYLNDNASDSKSNLSIEQDTREALSVFQLFSKGCPSKYDYDETVEQFEKLLQSYDPSRPQVSLEFLYADRPISQFEHEWFRDLLRTEDFRRPHLVFPHFARLLSRKYDIIAGERYEDCEATTFDYFDLYMYTKGKYDLCSKKIFGVEFVEYCVDVIDRFKVYYYHDMHYFERLNDLEKLFFNSRNDISPAIVDRLWTALQRSSERREFTNTVLSFTTGEIVNDQGRSEPIGYYYDLNGHRYVDWTPSIYVRTTIHSDPKNVSENDRKELLSILVRWFGVRSRLQQFFSMQRSFVVPGNELDRSIYVIHGEKHNGKSLCTGIIEYAYGKNDSIVIDIPHSEFTVSKAISATLLKCRGDERILVVRDFPFHSITHEKWGLLKNISGTDPVSDRVPYGHANFKKRINGKIVIVSNELPTSIDEAVLDRLNIIPMLKSFGKDVNKKADYLLEKNLKRLGAALMNIVLAKWTQDEMTLDKFIRSEYRVPRLKTSEDYIKQIGGESDLVAHFILCSAECYELCETPFQLFYAKFKQSIHKTRNRDEYTHAKVINRLIRLGYPLIVNTDDGPIAFKTFVRQFVYNDPTRSDEGDICDFLQVANSDNVDFIDGGDDERFTTPMAEVSVLSSYLPRISIQTLRLLV